MSTSTSARTVVKTVLFIAEKRWWTEAPWHYMTGVRPNTDKDRVLADLRKYLEKRKGQARGSDYRVIEYVRNNRAHPGVVEI